MEHSIETIWKEGFLKSDALVAPKINDLYNQKSKHTIDKLMRMGEINLVAIMIGAAAILVGSIFAGAAYAGAAIFLLLTWVVIYGKKQGGKMKEINKGLSSYQYIKAVDTWLKEVISGYTRLYRILYPTFVLIAAFGYNQETFNEIMANSPDLFAIFGIPAIWGLGFILLAGLSSLLAGPIYKFDLYLVYGRVFKKLDEIIADMEELRN